MTNSTRLIGLIMTTAMLVGHVAAEELPGLSYDYSLGADDLTLPPFDESMLPPPRGEGSRLVPPGAGYVEPGLSPLAGGAPRDHFHGLDGYDGAIPSPLDLWDGPPAPIESTGTWLRRGFWYAEVDAVVWNRHWNRDNKWFAAQDPDVNNPLFFANIGNVIQLLNTNRLLVLEGAQPGQDTSVRATLGHFLFRDLQNRDHTAEFTAHGGGDWEQDRVIRSEGNFGLFVPFVIDGGNRSFDGASRQSLAYSSHFNSFEFNYRVRQRLKRDKLMMDPNGAWYRGAQPGITRDYLVGLRFLEMRDILNWQAQDIFVLGSDGQYQIRTDNDLFGFQMGAGMTYEKSRWSVGANAKGGVFVNDALARSTLDFTADDFSDFDLRLTNDELSFVGEFRLQGRWHLTPNFSLRAAYEMMYLTSVALAPNQANFITEFATLNTTQDPFYHGASFGFEGYW